MASPIVSNNAQVDLWSGLLKSDFHAAVLHGVDDDNTLAESGVYNSCNSLCNAANSVLRSLSSDASNLISAVQSYECADAASAGGFR